MIDILLKHLEIYPAMEIQDCVKLMYQHAFGAEHMMHDPQKMERYLEQEYKSAPDNEDRPYLSIGNGLCRVSLPACRDRGISAEVVFDAFLKTAERFKKDEALFHQQLNDFSEAAFDGVLPFETAECELFLLQYREKGMGALHHSEKYRQLYKPSYRVIIQQYAKKLFRDRD